MHGTNVKDMKTKGTNSQCTHYTCFSIQHAVRPKYTCEFRTKMTGTLLATTGCFTFIPSEPQLVLHHFSINALSQSVPLLSLYNHTFGLMPSGWLCTQGCCWVCTKHKIQPGGCARNANCSHHFVAVYFRPQLKVQVTRFVSIPSYSSRCSTHECRNNTAKQATSVGLSLLNYQDNARSNKHKIHLVSSYTKHVYGLLIWRREGVKWARDLVSVRKFGWCGLHEGSILLPS